MANINKQITITEQGGAAGPYFDVYYSTDCISYTICSDGSNVYLPSIGSSVIVTCPDTTICFKLVNKSNQTFCLDNSVISGSIPTTTTTTTEARSIKQFNINGTNNSQVQYLNKFNETKTITFNNVNEGARVCAWSDSIVPLTNGITSSIHLNYCPDNDYVRLYTSNAANNKAYTFESSSGEVVQFFGANPTSYDITRCIVSGSYLKQTNSTNQLISSQGYCPTTTTTTTTAAPSSASLSWIYSIQNSPIGANMEIYVNGTIVENRYANSYGVWPVYLGDTIRIKITTPGCSTPNSKANSYVTGLFNDAACDDNVVELTTTLYTVVSGDLGTTLSVTSTSRCDVGCV
jgi:hypothetical protein